MRLGANVAFAFNSLAQGPVTRKSCRRRESNPGSQDSRPDALATLPPRFACYITPVLKVFLHYLRIGRGVEARSGDEVAKADGGECDEAEVGAYACTLYSNTYVSKQISNSRFPSR